MVMNITQESAVGSLAPAINLIGQGDRRADVDAKQAMVAALLQEAGCDGLLVLEAENFSWLSSGGASRGVLDAQALPVLYYTPEGRWAVCANVDTQRLFDEELDGLGFQVKEWPWHWGRAQLLADLCQGRTVACDIPPVPPLPRGSAGDSLANEGNALPRGGEGGGSFKLLADTLHQRRLALTEYEKACYRALGQILSHALEATGRTLSQGETEREVAGQLAHRLYHRGAQPLMVMVAADGRSRLYRQGSFTAAPVHSTCVLLAAARKYGLCAMASRIVSFGAPEAGLRKEHDAACRVSATYIAGSWPDSMPKQILTTGRRIYQIADFEHEWLLAPQGHVTGRLPVEMPFTPQTEDLMQNGWAVTWNATVGAASSCDTFLISEEGPRTLTPVENWPLKRIRIQGADFVRPDIMIR